MEGFAKGEKMTKNDDRKGERALDETSWQFSFSIQTGRLTPMLKSLKIVVSYPRNVFPSFSPFQERKKERKSSQLMRSKSSRVFLDLCLTHTLYILSGWLGVFVCFLRRENCHLFESRPACVYKQLVSRTIIRFSILHSFFPLWEKLLWKVQTHSHFIFAHH